MNFFYSLGPSWPGEWRNAILVLATMERTIKLYRLFVWLAGAVLTLTCLAKLVSVFGSAEALTLPDALFGLQNRWVMLLAGFAEAFVIGVLMSKLGPLAKLGSVLWLSLSFALTGFVFG